MQNSSYSVYRVGGAIRDKLLGYPYTENDWVVVGASPQSLIDEGFQQVGQDFPVFLHPQSREEYALARLERKTGHGYVGFQFDVSASVSLEDDLQRRDLTINAMAEDEHGQVIDPYGGKKDLELKLLRHVSPAFAEDPVRILRVARFAARYHHLGFTVAEETMNLMQSMVNQGEADHLVAERVWKEMERALGEKSPRIFFEVMRECGALSIVAPELNQLFGVPQPPEHHPEVDTGIHSLMVLEQASKLTESSRVRFAALLHDLGKGTTPREEWPKHIGHESRGIKLIETLCDRLGTPKAHRELAIAVCRDHTNCHRAETLKPATVLKLLQRLDAFRRPEKLEEFLIACTADCRGRTGYELSPYPQAEFLKGSLNCCADISVQAIIEQGAKGKQIGEAIARERVKAIESYTEQWHQAAR